MGRYIDEHALPNIHIPIINNPETYTQVQLSR